MLPRGFDRLGWLQVSKAYFGLLDVLCHSHQGAIATCDTATFAFLVSSLDAGLKSLDVSVSSQCAAAIDNLASYYLKHAIASDTPSPTAQARSCALNAALRNKLLHWCLRSIKRFLRNCMVWLPTLQAIGEHLRQRPELFPAILTTLFEVALFENCSNQWSLSRPMLSLILLNEQVCAPGIQAVTWSSPNCPPALPSLH